MALRVHIIASLSVIPFVFCCTAWAAGEEAAPGSGDAATATVVEEPAAVAEAPQTATKPVAELALPPPPPPSLQTIVDERRDALRKRREARFDRYSGRYFFMPPGMLAHEEAMERYRDAIRELYRQQRDYNRMYREARISYMSPWSKPFHDLAEDRHYAMQMEQLDWQELRDDLMLGHPFAYGGPIGFPW